MYSFSYLEPVCCFMSSSNCCFLTCIQVSQEVGQVVWYCHLFHNFPQFIVIHTVEGFGVVNRCMLFVYFYFIFSAPFVGSQFPEQGAPVPTALEVLYSAGPLGKACCILFNWKNGNNVSPFVEFLQCSKQLAGYVICVISFFCFIYLFIVLSSPLVLTKTPWGWYCNFHVYFCTFCVKTLHKNLSFRVPSNTKKS